MNRNKLLLTVTLFFIFSGCISQKIVGDYEYKKGLVYHELIIKNDSTFEYRVSGDLLNSRSKGTWKMKGDELILDSYEKYHPYLINEHYSENVKHVLISIKDTERVVIPGNYVIISSDKEKRYFVDEKGLIAVPKQLCDFTSFTIYAMNGEHWYQRKNAKSNVFDVSYNASMPNQLYFENESFKVEKGKLLGSQGNLTLKRRN